MSATAPNRIMFLTALFLVMTGCDSTYPPKLNGLYSLESARSGDWTGGATLNPPAVTGSLRLSQWSVGPEWTYGYVQLELTHSSGPSGSQTSSWSGNYGNDGTGQMMMTLDGVKFEGQFDRDGESLTTDLSGEHSESGPSPAGTITWRLDEES